MIITWATALRKFRCMYTMDRLYINNCMQTIDPKIPFIVPAYLITIQFIGKMRTQNKMEILYIIMVVFHINRTLSVGWENGPERGHTIVSFNPYFQSVKQTVQTLIRRRVLRRLIWVCTVSHCFKCPSPDFTDNPLSIALWRHSEKE